MRSRWGALLPLLWAWDVRRGALDPSDSWAKPRHYLTVRQIVVKREENRARIGFRDALDPSDSWAKLTTI